MTQTEPLQALPDLPLSEAAARWRLNSPNAVKARAAALGVQLRRESPTRTVWPSEAIALGDRLAEHLKRPGANLRNFPEAAPAVTAPAAGSDGVSQTAPWVPGDGGSAARRPGRSALTPATAGSDGLAALAQLAAALNPAPSPDPLGVARGLAEAAELGAWLSSGELAQLLGMAPATVRNWSSGHHPRPGFTVERRKDGAAVWWRISATD